MNNHTENTNIQTLTYYCTTIPIYEHPNQTNTNKQINTLRTIQTYTCTNIRMCNYTNIRIYKNKGIQVHTHTHMRNAIKQIQT